MTDFLRGIVSKIQDFSAIELVVFIFLNNARSSLVGLIAGLFFGIIPILVSLTNGIVIGVVLRSVFEVTGFSDFWRLLPHGVFELTAVFISLGLGVKLGTILFSKDAWYELKRRLWLSVVVFLQIVIPLLVLAATIEGILIALHM